MRDTIDRRTVLRTGAIATAGLLAGCSGGGGGGGEETTAAETDAGGGGGDGGVPSSVESYLSDVGNFDGSVADRTGRSEATVDVGAEGNGGNFAFDPPAIRVDAGTTVVWEWTGKGGQHNVVAESGADFESELVSDEGHTFSWTAGGSGPVTYVCVPHESLGMKGAILIA